MMSETMDLNHSRSRVPRHQFQLRAHFGGVRGFPATVPRESALRIAQGALVPAH
jgi:hypothetical protein